jgi:hypothetical protein
MRAALKELPCGTQWGLSGVVVGVMPNMVGEVDDQLGPPSQVLPPVGVIVDRSGNSG